MKKSAIIVCLMIFATISASTFIASADSYEWKGGTYDWLNASNWAPGGFTNNESNSATINNGTATTGISSSTFYPNLTLELGGVIETPTSNAQVWTARYLIMSGGMISWLGGNSQWAGTIYAKENTISIFNVTGNYPQNGGGWVLAGNGTINKTGSQNWGLTTSSSEFNGVFNVNGGQMTTSTSGTFGTANARFVLNSGGTIERGGSSGAWSFPGGIIMNGGTIFEDGNNGMTLNSNLTIISNSTIKVDGPSSGNRPWLRVDGSLNGAGNLSVDTTNNDRGLSFWNAGNYSGVISLENQSYLYLGESNVFSENASMVLKGDGSNKSLLTIGGYKTSDSLTNVNNVNIVLSNIIINGTKIVAAGHYDSTNQDLLNGYVVFNNALSSLNVTIGDLTPPAIGIIFPANTTYNYTIDHLNYSYSDINPGYCWYSNDSGITNSTSVSAGVNFSSVSAHEGSNTWILYCNDSGGNLNQTSVSFVMDLTKPNAAIINPANETETNNVTQNFTLNVSDNISLQNATLFIYNESGLYNQTSVNLNGATQTTIGIVVNLVDGVYHWFWHIFDSAGNFFSTQPNGNYTLTEDTTPPSITGIVYSPNYFDDVDPGQNISFNATINDSLVGIDKVILQAYNGTGWANYTMSSTNGADYNATITLAGNEANYTYNILANDTLGNANSSTNSTIISAWDCSWNLTSAALGATAGFNENKNIGNITIINTGDSQYATENCTLTFRMTYSLAEGRIYFDNKYFKPSDSYTINAKGNTTIKVNATFLAEVSEENAIIIAEDITGRSNTAERNMTATIVSTTGGPYLHEEITYVPEVVYLKNNAFNIQGTLRNLVGDGNINNTAFNVSLNWSLPSAFNYTRGNLTNLFENISDNSLIEKDLNVSFNATNLPNIAPGIYIVYLIASGFNSSGDPIVHSGNRTVLTESATIILSCYIISDGICVAACGNTLDPDCPITPPEAPKTGGGGAVSIGGGTTGASSSIAYTEGIEVVRKEKNSFDIEVRGRGKNITLENLRLQIIGYPSQYLRITPAMIGKIEYGETKKFTVTLVAPSYESYEEIDLKATISGTARGLNYVSGYNEVHNIHLIIQEIGEKESRDQIALAKKTIESLREMGINVKGLEQTLSDANSKLAEKRNKDAYDFADQVIERGKIAIEAYNLIKKLKSDISYASKGASINGMAVGVNEGTSSASNLVNLAESAFERGDFETALERAQEAEKLLKLEYRASFTGFIQNNGAYIAVIALFSALVFMFALRVYKKSSISRKIEDAKKEELEISMLLAKNQKRYFAGKISHDMYDSIKEQYGARLAKIKRDSMKLRSRRVRLLKPEEELKELNLESNKLQREIKKIQEAYYVKKSVSEDEYKEQFAVFNSRLAEIEEERATAQIITNRNQKKPKEGIKTYPEVKLNKAKGRGAQDLGFKIKMLKNKIKNRRHKHGK